MINIAVLTPARDEEENIPKLYSSLTNIEGCKIYWLIIENGSSDNTLEVCKRFLDTKNLSISLVSYPNMESYSVGRSLSKYLSDGLKLIIKSGQDFKYLSILDADVIIPSNYYIKIFHEMNQNKNLMLTSGKGVMDGFSDGEGELHVRGNARVWRYDYIKKRGIPVEPSWDSISKFHVLIDKYEAYPINVSYQCRPMIVKQNNASFYGYAAAFRGVTLIFCILKTIKMMLAGQPGISYLYGYLENKILIRDISQDEKLLTYVKKHCRKQIIKKCLL